MTDVTRERFPVEVLKIIQDIADSHFVAIDLEFSGVSGRGQRNGKPTLEELYQETKNSAEKYQVLQIGLTVVKEDTVKGKLAVAYGLRLREPPVSTLEI